MNRFKVTKIGLLNFWLYDEEEFDFYGGNLILRGSNGSGKSVTMQSFIPLILDGNKSPERLDPFGSKERKIEDYIIGDVESTQKEESTAYLYMETYNEEQNKYITIGLGFRGRKGRPVESWGFCLKDGMRIGKDFYLYKDTLNKIPLSKNELKSRLGTINEFVDNTKDYKAMVNRLLFGFPNLDMYDEFIKLLLQLRSNKLSKEYKPTDLIDVLNKVLQPLTEEDLRPLSEAIEQMNKTKEQIEILEKNSKALKDFLKVYRNYNELCLSIKAKNYKVKDDEYKDINKKIKSVETTITSKKDELSSKNKRLNEVVQEIEVNNNTKKELDNSDLKQKIESLATINDNIKNLNKKINELKELIQNDEEEKVKLNKSIKNIENEIFRLKENLTKTITDLKDLASDIYFDEFKSYDLNIDENNSDFDNLSMALKKYQNRLNVVLELFIKEEKILSDSESTKIDYEKLNREHNQLSDDLEKSLDNLKESIMAWEEDFINKLNNNKELKIEDNYKKTIFDLMNDYSQENFMQVKSLYNECAFSLINKIKMDNLTLASKSDIKRKDLIQLEDEYKKLKEQDDIEIPSLNIDAEETLKSNNIVSIPLYKVIEFKEGLDEELKNNLEAELLDLGILNAKIIKNEDIPKVNKLKVQLIYLTKSSKKKNNLLKYFNVKVKDDIIKEDYVKEILESISIDSNDSMAVTPTGIAKMDILNSQADKNYKQNFIGYLKRLELKENKLKELDNNIEVLTNELKIIQNAINNNDNKISVIESEMGNLPSNKFIMDIENKISEINKSLIWNEAKQKELVEKLNVFTNELNKIKEKILNSKEGLNVPLNKESYKEVLNILNSFKDELQRYNNLKNSYLSKLEIQQNYLERFSDIEDNISYRIADRNEKTKELEVNKSNRDTINELLETKEFKDQKEMLLKAEENLRNLGIEKDNLIKDTAMLNQDIKYKEEEYSNLLINKENIEKELIIYEEILLREYKLGYVYEEELTDPSEIAKKVISNNYKDKNLNDVERNFFESFNRYSLELNDYSLKTINIFNDYEVENEKYQKIYNENSRIDVTANYQGIKLNVITLSKKLENDILDNKDLISTQDRHLFEDILLNTVGEKIRNRINSSNEWVNKINNIMKEMQENSALSFKLIWKSISAPTESEIDTKELVRILKMDPTMLKDIDKENLTNHFRSKIRRAEELYSDSYIPFSKIIEEVLDYRSWFTFQLLYQRKGEDFKELTNKIFAKLSGGERAKSMYIPLFASVFAKLNSAREDSLRLIALDEAFAGVDEDNIREMFGILSFLNLDFIINSQALWGDYDTVNDLSICNLIRPNNSSVVSVERYRWNGKYKEIINNRMEYNKELENA